MGRGGRAKKKASSAATDDDELLNAAISESQEALKKLELEKAQAEAEKVKAKRAQVAKQVATARCDAAGEPLSSKQIVSMLDAIPCFCIVNAAKKFVPLRMTDKAGNAEDCCVFWTEPVEAKDALAQAVLQRPEGESLAMGTMPLGKAFALCEGWAEAEVAVGCAFQLRAHAVMVKELRPLLTQQLETMGLSTTWVFPVFLCEELTTDSVMPIFLSRADVVSTWEAAMMQAGHDVKKATPPSKLTVLDLRMLAQRMQSGGMDWSIVSFVGMDRAFEAVREAQAQEAQRQSAPTAPLPAVAPTTTDPDDEPPPLE